MADRFELGAQVGKGSFGVVYAAKEIATGDGVAVKVRERAADARCCCSGYRCCCCCR